MGSDVPNGVHGNVGHAALCPTYGKLVFWNGLYLVTPLCGVTHPVALRATSTKANQADRLPSPRAILKAVGIAHP